MRIAHITDIHIRNLKYHPEYRRVFGNLCEELDKRNVGLAVNTGDTAHTKTQISPEFVQVTSELFVNIAKICPLVNVLGNHDLNLMNADRQDAISPIVEALNNPRIILWKKSGMMEVPWNDSIVFHNFGIADHENWPKAPYNDLRINIGLYHGSVINSLTDSNFQMKQAEADLKLFDGLDFVMLGDIHKRQSFNDGRIWYAGSLIQQNFGEELDKGFLIWDIRGKSDWDVEFVPLRGARKFYTVKLNDDLTLPKMDIEADSHIRISPPRPLTLVEQKTAVKIVKKRWNPHDVIALGVANIGQQTAMAAGSETMIENLRQPEVQERLIRDFLKERKLPENIVQKVLDLNRRFQVVLDQKDDIARNVRWKISKMGWSNLFNYGEGNVIDLSRIKGLSGIFAPNASGKSSMIDVVTVGAFDANTKEVTKNIHLVNDNKEKAVVILEIIANNERYTVERVIERIKFGQRTKKNVKEWGKTSLNFVRQDPSGAVESLVEESRPATERNIRRRLGTFDDFMLTSLSAQWNPMDIIGCKETERKRILYKFLDLEIFEQKANLAKEEAKEWIEKLAELEESGYESALKQLEERIIGHQSALEICEDTERTLQDQISEMQAEIESLATQKIPVQVPGDLTQLRLKLKRLDSQFQDAYDRLKHKMAREQEKYDEHNKLGEMLKLIDYDAHSANLKRLEELENQAFSWAATAKELKRTLEEKRKQAGLLSEVPCGDAYPTCKFLLNAFKAKEQIADLERDLENVNQERTKLLAEVKKIESSRSIIDEYNDTLKREKQAEYELKKLELEKETLDLMISKLRSEAADVQKDIAATEQVKKDIETNRQLDIKIAEVKVTIQGASDMMKSNHSRILDHTKKMGADQATASRIQEELAKLKETRDTCTAYEHFTAAMGKDGIALQILTQKLPHINEEINKILGSATDFGVYIEFDQEEQSIKLNLQYGQYKSRLLELGSGAEKFLASLAIRAALLSISSLPKTNMFIIDEGFGKLDPTRMEAIQRMFDYLKSVFDHVIVISHTDLMKDMVDNIIDITADEEGYAHIEIGG